jgi:hypothetical protein
VVALRRRLIGYDRGMDINAAAEAADRFLQGYTGRGGRRPTEVRSHPSGDDMNAIKIWVNLGAAADGEDLGAWCTEAEAAIRKAVPGLDAVTIELRADAM